VQHEIAIAGGHGKVARRMTRLLAARGDWVRSLIRNPAHADDVREDCGLPVICDLEVATVDQIAQAINGVDGVVFAAGAGPGSGPERKLTLDRDGAIKLLAATERVGVMRYLMISAVGAENPPDGDDSFSVYLRAKAEADRALERSDRRWTIVRPGRLTDDPGTGHVRIDIEPYRDTVTRDDVAAVADALLHEAHAVHRIFYVNEGDEPLEDALRTALSARGQQIPEPPPQ
jgi:uncharacterized protein YbjT (DUF2867 family)